MKPFLRQAAEKFLAEGDVSGKCFIFPNRRSLVFFRKHLAAALSEAFSSAAEDRMSGDSVSGPASGPCSGPVPGQGAPVPIIAPEMLTVNDFFYKVYDVAVTDRVTLLLELYECYKALNRKAEPLDEFIFWGVSGISMMWTNISWTRSRFSRMSRTTRRCRIHSRISARGRGRQLRDS